MIGRLRARSGHGEPSLHDAYEALTACPPPWVPLAAATHHHYERVVEAHAPALVKRASAHPEQRAWLLVRYLRGVPAELVERCLSTFKREATEFCELAGGTPDVAAAETWEAQWRADASKARPRRRAAS